MSLFTGATKSETPEQTAERIENAKAAVHAQSEERKAALKDAADKRKAARKEALAKILAFAKDNLALDTDGSLAAALRSLTPLRAAVAEHKETMADKIARMFATRDTINGYDAYNFEACHYGTSDMRRNLLLALKTAEPDKRVWVEYDGKSDEYRVMGRGKEAPLGWTGYVPNEA